MRLNATILLLLGLVAAATNPCRASAAPEIIESFIARASEAQPRQTEADIVVLRDGAVLAAWCLVTLAFARLRFKW
jgi:hypothetical protein